MKRPRLTLCFKLMGSFIASVAMVIALSLCALNGIGALVDRSIRR